METWNNVLSFEDLQTYDNRLIDSVAEIGAEKPMSGPQIATFVNKERPELIARWVHTFLEWDQQREYFCCVGWTLKFVPTARNIDPLVFIARVDTLQEAKTIAKVKISRYLGIQVHLVHDKQGVNLGIQVHSLSDNISDNIQDELYKVISNGKYQGLIEIKPVAPLYYTGWTLSYVSASKNISPLVSTAYVNTLKEAEIIAAEKISSYLGIQVHLNSDNVEDKLYRVDGKSGTYQGMVEIKPIVPVRKV